MLFLRGMVKHLNNHIGVDGDELVGISHQGNQTSYCLNYQVDDLSYHFAVEAEPSVPRRPSI